MRQNPHVLGDRAEGLRLRSREQLVQTATQRRVDRVFEAQFLAAAQFTQRRVTSGSSVTVVLMR
jgi:hypothetical protein